MFYKTTEGDYVTGIIRVRPIEINKPKKPGHNGFKGSFAYHMLDKDNPTYENRKLNAMYKYIKTVENNTGNRGANFSLEQAEAAIKQKHQEKYEKALDEFERQTVSKWEVTLADGSKSIITENPLEEVI